MKNRLQKTTKLSANICLLFALIVGLHAAILLKPSKASAEEFNEQNNAMLLMVEHCQGIQDEDKEIGIDVKGGDNNGIQANCQGYKNILNDELGCSDSLFKKSRSRAGNDVYYLDSSLFRDCYKRAKAQYERLGGNECNNIEDGSEGYESCKNNNAHLYYALGCGEDLYQSPNSNNRRFVRPNAYASCGQRIAQMSAVRLKYIDKNGDVQTMAVSLGATDEEFNGDPGTSGSGSGANIDTADCDPAFGLGWIACSASEFMANFAKDIFESVIGPMLENVPVSLQRDGAESGAFKAWQAIRVIANALLVISLLAIVYAQAKGGD